MSSSTFLSIHFANETRKSISTEFCIQTFLIFSLHSYFLSSVVSLLSAFSLFFILLEFFFFFISPNIYMPAPFYWHTHNKRISYYESLIEFLLINSDPNAKWWVYGDYGHKYSSDKESNKIKMDEIVCWRNMFEFSLILKWCQTKKTECVETNMKRRKY